MNRGWANLYLSQLVWLQLSRHNSLLILVAACWWIFLDRLERVELWLSGIRICRLLNRSHFCESFIEEEWILVGLQLDLTLLQWSVDSVVKFVVEWLRFIVLSAFTRIRQLLDFLFFHFLQSLLPEQFQCLLFLVWQNTLIDLADTHPTHIDVGRRLHSL